MGELTPEALNKKLEEMQAQIDEQAEQITALETSKEDLLKVIGDARSTGLSVSKETAAAPKIPEGNVKVDGKIYAFTAATFHLPGHVEAITAEQAITDAAILKEILAIDGQGILREIFE